MTLFGFFTAVCGKRQAVCGLPLHPSSLIRRVRRTAFIPHPSALILVLCLPCLLPCALSAVDWSSPQAIAPDSADPTCQTFFTVDACDTAIWVAWSEYREADQAMVKASRYSSGRWTPPEFITRDTQDAAQPAIAVDAQGRPMVVWDSTPHWPESTFTVWSRRQGDTWTLPKPISDDTLLWGTGADIAAVPERGAWATWSCGPDDSVYTVAARFCGDTWQTPDVLLRSLRWWFPYSQVLTAPPGGETRVVWVGSDIVPPTLFSVARNGDTWGRPEHITGSALGSCPAVCTDSSGNTWAIWMASGGEFEIVYSCRDRQGWSEPMLLGNGYLDYANGALCTDSCGRVWAVWCETLEDGSSRICARYHDGTGWSELSVVAQGEDAAWPKVVAAFGQVWVIWGQRHPPSHRYLLMCSHTLPTAIAETPTPERAEPLPGPTVVRNVLVWSATTPSLRNVGDIAPHSKAKLLNASGRKVMDLKPGENDIRHLSPGIYFIQLNAVDGRRQAVTKVILAR
jgi:hypothetical protein